MSGGSSLCCVPLSGPTGIGELARQLTLAAAARQRRPALRCHFVLHAGLPAAARKQLPDWCEVSWLAGAARDDDRGVAAALDACRPDVVVFDNTGSGAQCRHAHRLGARTVYVSSRPRSQARAFGRDWLRALDEHWLIGPRALAPRLPLRQWWRAAAFGIRLRRLQALFAVADAERAEHLRHVLGLTGRRYVCFVPSGGGGTLDGAATAALFAAAAARVARRADAACVLLLGPLHEGPPPGGEGVVVHRATHAETVDLVGGAHLAVVGASSILFQALAQGRVCVATSPAGSEHLARARAWARRHVIAAAAPEAAALADETCALLADPPRFAALQRRVERLAVDNDLPRALTALEALLPGA